MSQPGRSTRLAPVAGLALAIMVMALPTSASAQDIFEFELGTAGSLDLGGLLEIIDVVVTPAKKEQSIEQAPAIVSVIKREQIEENSYQSVAEALRQVPGVYIRDDLLHPNASMRGIDAGLRAWGRNLKVMINGQPISYRSDTSNWLGPELLPMGLISRIEIVRGPSSTLYGANAFLGVVNILTEDSFEKDWVRFSLDAGMRLRPCFGDNKRVEFDGEVVDLCAAGESSIRPVFSTGIAAGHSIQLSSETSIRFLAGTSVGYSDRSGLLLPATSPHLVDSGPRYYSGDVEDVTSKDDTDLSLSAYGHADLLNDTLGELRIEGHYSEFARHGEFTDWGVLTHENRVGMRNWYVRLSQEKRLQKIPLSWQLRASLAGGGHTSRNHLQIARDNSFWVKKEGGYLGFDLSAELAYDFMPELTVVVGTTLTDDSHDLPSIFSVEDVGDDGSGEETVEIPSYTQGKVQFVNFSVFGQALYAPIDALSLIAGVSFEQHNVYGDCDFSSCPGLNSRLGVTYSLIKTSKWSLYTKLLYGSSFKAPSAELLYGTPYVVSGISGNLDLEPQVAHTLEAAVGSGTLLTGKVHIDLLVNGFLNFVNGKVEYVQAGNFTRAMNSSNLRSVGAESSLRVGYKDALSSYFNLSWQKTVVTECLLDDEALCRRQGEFNYLYPTFLLSFGATYRHKPWHLRGSLYGAFVGSRWASQSNRAENIPTDENAGFDNKAYQLPSYLLLNLVLSTADLRLAFQKETVFSLGFYNLLNAGIAEPGFGGIDTPGLGLTILGSVKQRF